MVIDLAEEIEGALDEGASDVSRALHLYSFICSLYLAKLKMRPEGALVDVQERQHDAAMLQAAVRFIEFYLQPGQLRAPDSPEKLAFAHSFQVFFRYGGFAALRRSPSSTWIARILKQRHWQGHQVGTMMKFSVAFVHNVKRPRALGGRTMAKQTVLEHHEVYGLECNKHELQAAMNAFCGLDAFMYLLHVESKFFKPISPSSKNFVPRLLRMSKGKDQLLQLVANHAELTRRLTQFQLVNITVQHDLPPPLLNIRPHPDVVEAELR